MPHPNHDINTSNATNLALTHTKSFFCLLRDLPPEILEHIFLRLEPKDLLRLRAVDRHLHLTVHSFEDAILNKYLRTFKNEHPDLDWPSTLGRPQRGLVCLVETQRQYQAAGEVACILADRIISKLDYRNTDPVPECKETWSKKKHDLLQRRLHPSIFLLGQFFRLFRDVVILGDEAFSCFSDQEYLELIDIYYLDQQYIMEKFQNATADTFIDATYAWWVLKGVCHAYGVSASTPVGRFGADLSKILLRQGMSSMRDILRIGADREAQLSAFRKLEITVDTWDCREAVRFVRPPPITQDLEINGGSSSSSGGGIYHLEWQDVTPAKPTIADGYGPSSSCPPGTKRPSRRWGVQGRFLNNQHIWDMAVVAILQRSFGTKFPAADVSAWLVEVLEVSGDRSIPRGRWRQPDRPA